MLLSTIWSMVHLRLSGLIMSALPWHTEPVFSSPWFSGQIAMRIIGAPRARRDWVFTSLNRRGKPARTHRAEVTAEHATSPGTIQVAIRAPSRFGPPRDSDHVANNTNRRNQ